MGRRRLRGALGTRHPRLDAAAHSYEIVVGSAAKVAVTKARTYVNFGRDWRRDFTANSLYYNIADFSLWDYVGGAEDIAARRLRLIGDPETRFREDPVRMLRAARFEAKLNCDIDPATAAPIQELRALRSGTSFKPYAVGECWDSERTIDDWLDEADAAYRLPLAKATCRCGKQAWRWPSRRHVRRWCSMSWMNRGSRGRLPLACRLPRTPRWRPSCR